MSNEKLKEQFLNTCKFSNHDSNKFVLLLQNAFILMSRWMVEKNSIKHYCLKK